MPRGKKERFNYAHSSLRNVIGRSFGVLKIKWRILLDLPSYPMPKQSQIIIACMALHNFIRDSYLGIRTLIWLTVMRTLFHSRKHRLLKYLIHVMEMKIKP